ncbi:MAG: quinolinate synthase NadA [Bifidobacteriaceae bacterium]|nr:quinolinate synthase NadA [Bifidobacteriaceae bacterium]
MTAKNMNPKHNSNMQQIPEEYANASNEELFARIQTAKAKLGDSVMILGHYYQCDDIIAHADCVGDSYQLAAQASTRDDVDTIIMCGVHFMAETADILSAERQNVIMPNMSAGCPMADMANSEQVDDAWSRLMGYINENPAMAENAAVGNVQNPDLQEIIPVTYMNSPAALKAFCGRNGGLVCTSSNARAVLEWAFARGKRVLFFPDEHLGRNTARDMGIDESQMTLWDPDEAPEERDMQSYADSKIILWKGFCRVHQRFTVEQIDEARENYPGAKVVVHPECNAGVVLASDGAGSTSYLVKQVEEAPEGAVIAIGTENHLVERLAKENPDKTVFCLDRRNCICYMMTRIQPAYLAWVLEKLVEGKVVNKISVDPQVAKDARTALKRMLEAK